MRATPLDCNFSSSIVCTSSHKRLNISETERAIGLKLSSNGVLLINIAIAIFPKNPIRRVYPDVVTFMTNSPRQKSDAEFAKILDCVRRGCPTDITLQQRVIDGSVTDKLNELSQSSQTPVCMSFPNEKSMPRVQR